MVMVLGPFLRREMITSVRSARVIHDRLMALLLVTGVVAGCVFVWDQWGWDQTSVSAAAQFALVAYGLSAFTQAGIAIGLVLGQVAPAIASERDRKSLDALLTTRLSSAEIVLGTMAAGLLRAANGLVATLPLVVLLVFLGGVDPGLVLLSGAGLASTALAVAAIAVVASVGARTRGRAVSGAAGLLFAWLVLPAAFLFLRMLLWPGGPRWLTQAALWLLDSSPYGVVTSLLGVMPRPGSVVERLLRMMALETAGAAVLTLWAAWRLRPASRALEDVEGQNARLRMLRQSRRRRPRPPCGDDPVLWNAIHTNRRATVGAWIEGRLIGLVWIGLIALVTSWFAVPAFRELAARGYGAAPEAFTMPAGMNPLSRVLCDILIMPTDGPAAGQARLEFNIALRQFSAFCALFNVVAIVVAAAEGVKRERERDTWLSLIATPLTGWEILRAKMLGPVLRGRGGALTLIGLWTVGLMAGALHPLGFLAAVTVLAVSAWFWSALGVSGSLREGGMERAGHPLALLVHLVPAVGAMYLLTAISVALAWSSLLSYEDVHSVVHSGAFPQFGATALQTVVGARTVVGVWLAGTTALGAWAFSLTRAMCRDFDVAVGRPTRPRGGALRP
jgi:ABC-type transport system involved in multi-copper enzyme maturation permease subunit